MRRVFFLVVEKMRGRSRTAGCFASRERAGNFAERWLARARERGNFETQFSVQPAGPLVAALRVPRRE